MVRLTGIVALLAVALLVADAYAYRTTVTTVEVDEENQRRQQGCHQMSARQELPSCDEFLKRQRQMQRRDVLQMKGNPKRSERVFDECCRELRNVDEQCRCDMLEEIAKAERQEGMQMPEMAKFLPMMCGVSQPCQF